MGTAIAAAGRAARKFISAKNYAPKYIKLEFATDISLTDKDDFIKAINTRRPFNFRYGAAFDTDFSSALTADELTADEFVNYTKEGDGYRVGTFRPKYMTDYYKSREEYRGYRFSGIPEQMVIYSNVGYFCDEDEAVFELFSDKDNYGRRIMPFSKDWIRSSIISSADWLQNSMDESGRMVYCLYPRTGFANKNYNILRHCMSLEAFLQAAVLNPDKKDTYYEAFDRGVDFMKSEVLYDKDGKPHLLDRDLDELKLGGAANVVILLARADEARGDKRYEETIRAFAETVVSQQLEDGSYWHVLNADFTQKDKYRTVYYDGEATLALIKAYGVTKDEKYLFHAEKAVRNFIANKYEKHMDHHIAYTMNELTKYRKNPEYFEFALKNAQANFEYVYKRDTSFHTFLEMLVQTYNTYMRMRTENIKIGYEFDAPRLINTINRRATHMMNGFLFPEIAMFTLMPDRVRDTFMVRHQNYRVRIDDIQHFINGYFEYYNHFDEFFLPQYFSADGIYEGKY
jgi:hypothetical protein